MSEGDLGGFLYRFEPGTDDARTLLLLHGTGGDHNDLVALGRSLAPGASLLSPRGRVLENGARRFFRRFPSGAFDIPDLQARTHELADFVAAAATEHSLDPDRIVAVGYSNGANIAGSLLLLRPEVVRAAILLRPMVPFDPDGPIDVAGVRVFIAAGRNDPLVPPSGPQRLAEILESSEAEVTLEWSGGGHELAAAELDRARSWLEGVGR